MERADSCRRAAFEAVADVEPPQLHDLVETTLENASMVPGVVTISSAAATTSGGITSDPTIDRDLDADGIATRAAGVQLIYEGLRLTRSLAHEEPWTELDPDSDGAGTTGDLEILAADILVARGFYLLARTDAAGKAVRTVQAFGRDQTRRNAVAAGDGPGRDDDAHGSDDDTPGVDPESIDANLERDILELAALTGAAAVGESPTPGLLATVDRIADAAGTSFPPASDCLGDLEPSPTDKSLDDHTTDRATSATDP